MQFVRNGPPHGYPGEEKVWLRDKSYRAHRDRDGVIDDDDQIKVTIHTTPNYEYEPKLNNQTNDKGYATDADGETLEMLEVTQTKLNNRNGRETKNGHHVNNYIGPYTNTTTTESIEAYDNL